VFGEGRRTLGLASLTCPRRIEEDANLSRCSRSNLLEAIASDISMWVSLGRLSRCSSSTAQQDPAL